jgi:hypothetical protein
VVYAVRFEDLEGVGMFTNDLFHRAASNRHAVFLLVPKPKSRTRGADMTGVIETR